MAIYLISIYLLAFFVAGIFILFRTVKNDKIELNFTFYNDKGLTDTSVEELDKLINRKKSFLL